MKGTEFWRMIPPLFDPDAAQCLSPSHGRTDTRENREDERLKNEADTTGGDSTGGCRGGIA